jgi:hypothetical protein
MTKRIDLDKSLIKSLFDSAQSDKKIVVVWKESKLCKIEAK